MIQRKTWEEFQSAGLLWWINRALHLFGWVICYEVGSHGVFTVYPARCTYRGFTIASEDEGFMRLTQHLSDVMPELKKEVKLVEKPLIDESKNPHPQY